MLDHSIKISINWNIIVFYPTQEANRTDYCFYCETEASCNVPMWCHFPVCPLLRCWSCSGACFQTKHQWVRARLCSHLKKLSLGFFDLNLRLKSWSESSFFFNTSLLLDNSLKQLSSAADTHSHLGENRQHSLNQLQKCYTLARSQICLGYHLPYFSFLCSWKIVSRYRGDKHVSLENLNNYMPVTF